MREPSNSAEAALAAVDQERIRRRRALPHLARTKPVGRRGFDAAFDAYRKAVALLPPAAQSCVELARLLAEEARGPCSCRSTALDRQSPVIGGHSGGPRRRRPRDRRSRPQHDGLLPQRVSDFPKRDPIVRSRSKSLRISASPDGINRAYGNLCPSAGQQSPRRAAAVMSTARRSASDLGARLNGATGNGVEALVRMGATPKPRLLA